MRSKKVHDRKLLINILVLAGVLVVALILALTGHLLPVYPETMPEDANPAARGYVYITAAGASRWFELPEEEAPLTLRRTAEDGTVIENTIIVTPEGAYMQQSTCENQDCVHQGVVTLENRTTRPLQNMILCLPNNVTLTLYSAEELAAMTVQE